LYIRNKRACHFLIDRFGRVHRIVAESDTANHAGHSVWADGHWLYIDLNASFLGVAFEASMQKGEDPVNEAQVRAARSLTEMLRAKYNLDPGNCVTHAQVSVNAGNMRIGWHTDWGGRFPFEQVRATEQLRDSEPEPLPVRVSVRSSLFEFHQPGGVEGARPGRGAGTGNRGGTRADGRGIPQSSGTEISRRAIRAPKARG